VYASAGGPWQTANKAAAQNNWAVMNRAKSRDNFNNSGILMFSGWGYSWLVNRRVFYNNSDVPGDVADFFMTPDSCSKLFVSTNTGNLNYSRWYRTIHRLADRPDLVLAGTTASPHFVANPAVPGGKISYAGRFPGHCEPYETNKPAFLATWGRNTKGGAAYDLVPTDTSVAGRDVPASTYPLVLTTIRCVEHFQGGPITRNNWFNVELEPEPWIELNSTDARAAGIVNGDYVKIVTARTEGFANKEIGSTFPAAVYGSGFRARVGSGLATGQKVGAGVVAIPWHWGEVGLSSGSRANDLCIDAGDANTMIPESKACLCRIEKII